MLYITHHHFFQYKIILHLDNYNYQIINFNFLININELYLVFLMIIINILHNNNYYNYIYYIF